MFSKSCKHAFKNLMCVPHKSIDESWIDLREVANGFDALKLFIAKFHKRCVENNPSYLKISMMIFFVEEKRFMNNNCRIIKAIDGINLYD